MRSSLIRSGTTRVTRSTPLHQFTFTYEFILSRAWLTIRATYVRDSDFSNNGFLGSHTLRAGATRTSGRHGEQATRKHVFVSIKLRGQKEAVAVALSWPQCLRFHHHHHHHHHLVLRFSSFCHMPAVQALHACLTLSKTSSATLLSRKLPNYCKRETGTLLTYRGRVAAAVPGRTSPRCCAAGL